MTLPRVLICGFPNSGTSFLCNLVAKMGFSPGSPEYLKPADQYNQWHWDYWEHLPMRELVWDTAFGHEHKLPRPVMPHFWRAPRPDLKNLLNHPERIKIQKLALEDSIEVYKDCLLPFLYTLFNPRAKYLVIKRSHREIFKSPKFKRDHVKDKLTINDLANSQEAYQECVGEMSKCVDCLIIDYNDFRANFVDSITRIATFLDVDDINLRELYKVFRPRNKHAG